VHELSIAESIVSGVVERVGNDRVTRIFVEIGKLSGVSADSVRFFFGACAKDTSLAGAELEIIETDGVARCAACGCEMPVTDLALACTCGSLDVELVRGGELIVKAVEIAPDAAEVEAT
jgi:hydrogenase nickel incorporation protein HypA/HybF